MPIYAYRCEDCGFQKDVLQKMSDPLLTVCPSCNKETFKKQLTAAGFQLKGSGWYATDFKGGSSTPAAKSEGDAKAGSTDSASTPAKTETAAASTPAAPPASTGSAAT